jgi:uroporphyrin-III C-methyltransferase/precorrin-2 dehydrogenase/sirohydrochlorin ferrochelatase
MSELLPLFVTLKGRPVLVVGGGSVAASKLASLRAAGADVRVVAPDVHPDIERAGVATERRAFVASDLDDVWLVVAAATPAVNRDVAAAAESRRVFVNAVDDPANATAFLSGVVRRDGVTVAISTSGDAPGLAALMREALDALLPRELGEWMDESRRQRAVWKRDGVPMEARRPLLLQALNGLYENRELEAQRASYGNVGVAAGGGPAKAVTTVTAVQAAKALTARTGHVSLVGAGPGDPGLLTRTAVARLRAADLVLFDALIDERVLRLARKSQRFFVGKRAGRHALSQSAIHAVMIRAARRGRRVVRLKGGDPFVFGRGAEEALALQQAGVSFDVVPGVSSAVAGPALAGIPVTHRGVAGSFAVLSGHDENAFAAAITGAPTTGMTLVVVMGFARRAALAAQLIAAGWRAETPAALIVNASTAEQTVWRGSVATVAAGAAEISGDGPALMVVGAVAALNVGGVAGNAHDSAEPPPMTLASPTRMLKCL